MLESGNPDESVLPSLRSVMSKKEELPPIEKPKTRFILNQELINNSPNNSRSHFIDIDTLSIGSIPLLSDRINNLDEIKKTPFKVFVSKGRNGLFPQNNKTKTLELSEISKDQKEEKEYEEEKGQSKMDNNFRIVINNHFTNSRELNQYNSINEMLNNSMHVSESSKIQLLNPPVNNQSIIQNSLSTIKISHSCMDNYQI